ncbi:hypothetical protein Thein_0096 [Thermodesulfatator indicus DSM 15286]|uniref:Uncharacterized protein n=1 Tax=Thermodesulfatator indicus (strain DSM 15286 / JCM 11887 / CIR29812) TaxID=667014 RepID=F8AE41_THEID|nr:hypothetical protein [Thermodesulfatator indicus]AEH43981.1 hypothetical protein Thein_0096 [Thermodesulfatator indicus DSM 15286]
MCIELKIRCKCGQKEASFNMRDNIMPQEVILGLYCPLCSSKVEFDETTMILDNGWLIEYDMDLARFMALAKLGISAEEVTPAFLFDEGYATWKELYPGELEDIKEEKEAIVAILKEDPQRYFKELRNWANARMARLKEEGWRKARFI